jgi:transcriptional regulator of heat shock response
MLSARQKLLLRSIIKEFIETAQEVGSVTLTEKYKLDVSPATIRNEMARLAELGILEKSHASSGRKPTSIAIKWFLTEINSELEDLDTIIMASIRENMFQLRFNVDKLLSEAVISLSKLTNNTALAMYSNRRYIAGISEFLDQPEYQDLQRLKKILTIMEDYNALSSLFSRYEDTDEVRVLVGEETGIDLFANSAVAFAPIKVHNSGRGYISVIGPNRMNYARVIPALHYIVSNIREMVEGW